MDTDSVEEFEEQEVMVFKKRGEKQINLSKTAEKSAAEVTENFQIKIQMNGNLDPHNRSKISNPIIRTDGIQFQHFFVKNKFKDSRAAAFNALRDLVAEKGIRECRKVSDKEEEQIMVMRVIQKVENQLNTFLIEDEDSQAKLQVKEGIVWVGMFAAVKVNWVDGKYRLAEIIDLSKPITKSPARLAADLQTYRMLFLRGPFRPKFGREDQGIKIISDEIKKIRKFNMAISCVVVFGPILAKNNKEVESCCLERTFQEEYETIVEHLRRELDQINQHIQLVILPSTDDVVSMYPIPQPAYAPEGSIKNVRFLSNPAQMQVEGKRSKCKINLINYDILRYIDTFKGGKATKELRQENLQTYLKQPFYLNNTLTEDPFDEVNMGGLYNRGNFGDLIVFSSQYSPPFINQVNGRTILNIGSLGVDFHYTGNHYMAIASIYQGEGPVAERVKIESVSSVI